ncbi:MAG TPA: hypothetical protein PLN21_20765 [Gemmatales bacterium]|nr:hypothetical protein [Gemmatales bacterium]
MEVILERLMRPEVLVPILIFGLPLLVWGVKASIVGTARARAFEAELNLKRELVAQGRSADDIEKIMRSNNRKMDA